MAGSLACNASSGRLLATHNQAKNTHEALSKASRHGRINDGINRTVEKGKKIDAEHAKIITMFSHVIALLELRYDGDHKVGRPGDGEAQDDNQNHFAHLPLRGRKDTLLAISFPKARLTLRRLTSWRSRLPCRLSTEVRKRERAIQKEVNAISSSGIR